MSELRGVFAVVSCILLLLIGGSAWGAEDAAGEEEAPEAGVSSIVQPALTVGLVEVIGLAKPPLHLGLYATFSLDIAFKLNPDWMLIPSFGFEFAPEFGNWGGVFLLIVDRFLMQKGDVVLAIDPQVGIIHDAAPKAEGGFDHSAFFAMGVGLAIVLPRAMIVPTILATVGLGGEGWALAPTLLFSVPF